MPRLVLPFAFAAAFGTLCCRGGSSSSVAVGSATAPSSAALQRTNSAVALDHGDAGRAHSVCVARVAQQQQLAAHWPEGSHSPPEVLGQCYPTAHGAWIYSFSALADDLHVGLTARFSILHLSERGAQVREDEAPFIPNPMSRAPGAPPLSASHNYVLQIGRYYTVLEKPARFDFDSDGEEELVVAINAFVEESGIEGESSFIFSHKADAATDAVAIQYAVRACPVKKQAVFLPVSKDNSTGWNGPCAKLWGATEAQVLAAIASNCRSARRQHCLLKSVRDDSVVSSPAIYERAAHTTPPLRLSNSEP